MPCDPFCRPVAWGVGEAGGLWWLVRAVSTPGMELWEGRALLPALGVLGKPQLARHGVSRVPVRCRRIPLPLRRGGGWVPASHPLCLPFLRFCFAKLGAALFPHCCMKFCKRVFPLLSSEAACALLSCGGCWSRGFTSCVQCSLDLFCKKLMFLKRTGWCGAGEQAQPWRGSQKRCRFGFWARRVVE